MATSLAEETTVGAEIPASAAVVVHSGPVMELASPLDIATIVRQRDDEQILASIMGEALAEWFYAFKIQGKLIEGVSVTGAMEFARIRAEQGFPIRFPPGSIMVEELEQNHERGIRCTVVSRCQRTGAEGIGMAFYPWHPKNSQGEPRLDDKADRKALSVAKRNSILDLIPEALVLIVLKERERITEANASRLLTAFGGPARPAPKAVTSGQRTQGAPAAADVPVCPKCGGVMYDNRADNEKRVAEKRTRGPDFKCKDTKKCDGVIWGAKKEKATEPPPAAPAADKPKAETQPAPSKAAAAVLECPGCGRKCEKASDHHPECRRYADD